MTDRLAKIFPYLLLAPAILPLVYVSGLVYPYIAPKIFLLYGVGIIALAVFAYLALSGRQFFYQRIRNKISWIPAGLLAVAYASSLFGIDFYRSFWGLFDRGDGLLTLSIVTTFFYLILISADRQILERLVKIVVVVAGIVAGIAVLQWIATILGGMFPFLPPVTGRIGSTFGNAAFLAGYLGMALFVALVVMRDSAGGWRLACQATIALSILAIFFAATRGTVLALVTALLVALAYVAWKGEGKVKRTARYSLVALLVFAGLFVGFREQLSRIPFEPIQRMASISLTDGTVSSRLFVWQNIGAEALQRPFLGYGAEHVAHLFNKVYDPSSIIEQWFDRSHNAYLDYFVQYGIFGLALYLALIGAFAVHALRLYRYEQGRVINIGFLFLLLILTYAVQNFFVFDTPHSLWLLYSLFATLLILLDNSPRSSHSFVRMPAFVPMLAGVVILTTIVPTVIQPFRANVMLTKGYLYHLIDVNRANAYFEKGLSLGTYADLEYGYQAYSMYTERQALQLKGDDKIMAYQYALDLLTANYKKYPYDARTATYLGHVIDTAPSEVLVDNVFDKEVLARAIELSPLRAQAWYMTVNVYLRQADALPETSPEREKFYREAITVLEEYAWLEPSLPVSRYILATIYYKLGDRSTAKKWADEGLRVYAVPEIAAAKPAVKYYIAISDWQNAVRFLADIVEANPSDSDALYDLAKVTYLAGDRSASMRIVEKIRETNPDILKTDQNFLDAITAYESR
jgi:O-antigen ligase